MVCTVEFIAVDRKSPVLGRPEFGCLSGQRVINVASGCALGCVYCYARCFSNAPPDGKVLVYVNTAERLEEELALLAKRGRLPDRVYFNTATDCFQEDPLVLDVAYEAMRLLLGEGVGVSFLSKGRIPGRFVSLFAEYPDEVDAEIGMSSVDKGFLGIYEPGAAPVEQRLANIRELLGAGVSVRARVDPLIPFISDTADDLGRLFSALAGAGVRRASASYLFLRPNIERKLLNSLPRAHGALLLGCFSGRVLEPLGEGQARYLPEELRRRGYLRAAAAARNHGIELNVCGCKNPDLDDIAPARSCVRDRPTAGPLRRSLPGSQLSLFAP
jgi:DNA repair photolyase